MSLNLYITIELNFRIRCSLSRFLYRNLPVSLAFDISPSSNSPAKMAAIRLGSAPSSKSGFIPNPPTSEF